MPKIYDTRKDKAKELLELVSQGPTFHPEPFTTLTLAQIEEMQEGYRIWVQSWVIPLVRELLKKDLQ